MRGRIKQIIRLKPGETITITNACLGRRTIRIKGPRGLSVKKGGSSE